MADDLSIMQRNAYLNNSYDQDSTHTALLESFQNSYSYLYELQRKEVEYEEFHYLSSNRVNVKESGHLYVLIIMPCAAVQLQIRFYAGVRPISLLTTLPLRRGQRLFRPR